MTIEHKKSFIKMNFDLETKSRGQALFKGYASIFDEVDSQNDRVVRGAFQKSLQAAAKAGQLPKMLWQHNEKELIGLWTTIREDAKGLYVEGKLLTDVAKAKEAQALIQEKALDGLSIGYIVKQALRGKERGAVRLLTEVELLEISLVTFPANAGARISV
ncbi:MAG: HK97 family phage prohead protease [Alphaproteobacteria bacterium]|nr:HK97 family phage prohead protease [Alphaproteobacteria bacterium]NCQ66636.1 HK97 family phage prohead protease [Alphaproteobacteria bacterium]NCT06988.1 HK97 family phage prohead protease [Alphaproteobacteria bacterium]